MKVFCYNKNHEGNEMKFDISMDAWICDKCDNVIIYELYEILKPELEKCSPGLEFVIGQIKEKTIIKTDGDLP